MGDGHWLGRRHGDNHIHDYPNRRPAKERLVIEASVRLAALCAAAACLNALLALAIFGPSESFRVVLAYLACLPPAVVALALVAKKADADPSVRIVAIAAATPIRFLATLFIAVVIWCVILSPAGASFWLWIVVAYAVTLAADVRLMLRVLRRSESNRAAGRPTGEDVHA